MLHHDFVRIAFYLWAFQLRDYQIIQNFVSSIFSRLLLFEYRTGLSSIPNSKVATPLLNDVWLQFMVSGTSDSLTSNLWYLWLGRGRTCNELSWCPRWPGFLSVALYIAIKRVGSTSRTAHCLWDWVYQGRIRDRWNSIFWDPSPRPLAAGVSEPFRTVPWAKKLPNATWRAAH
jgi:hypothetical protein